MRLSLTDHASVELACPNASKLGRKFAAKREIATVYGQPIETENKNNPPFAVQ